ncbi:MAG TPA: response regulator transcription factor [Opitutaceae bacterium]|nr:response regulator transcription factor [Opitutaceae bacterium]
MSAPSSIRILLVDDSELVRRGIKTVINSQPGSAMRVVGEAGTVAEAISESSRLKPDIVLLDIRLPDGTGFDACRKILERLPATRIVVLTSHSNDAFVYEAVTAGVHGYLMKEVDPAGLIQALEDVAAGRSILGADITTRVLRLIRGGQAQGQSPDISTLSPQERRVLALVADGKTNKQIAEQLELSENTVKNYLVNVFEKLQVKRRAQAAIYYVQQTNPPHQQ